MKAQSLPRHSPLKGAWLPLEFADHGELLVRCRQGEEQAWKELYDAHFAFVWRTARHLGTPPGELDDVCQEAFVVAFRKLDTFSTGRLSTWLYRITANVVSHRHRQHRVREALSSLWGAAPDAPPLAPGPDGAYEAREAEVLVGEVLRRLGQKKREVFALYELEGLSGEEIAERVGCKVDTVWTRLHYARRDFERIARKRGYHPGAEDGP